MHDSTLFDRVVLQRLYRYACALCRNQDDAYDLLHYALEKFLQSPSRRNRLNDLAYVRTMMRNRFIDEYRRSSRFPHDSYDESTTVAMDETCLEDIAIAQADLEIVWERLDPFERELLYYWAVEGMTAREIASQIDVPRGTVLSRIHRVRKKIARQMDSGQVSEGQKP